MEKKNKYELALFLLTLITCLFWIFSRSINVYDSKIVGAIFELAFLPMLILFFVMPILLLIQVFKTKTTYKSYSIISLVIIFITIMYITNKD